MPDDPAGLDQYLERFETPQVSPRTEKPKPEKRPPIKYMLRAPTCFYCGDDGCRRCMDQ